MTSYLLPKGAKELKKLREVFSEETTKKTKKKQQKKKHHTIYFNEHNLALKNDS